MRVRIQSLRMKLTSPAIRSANLDYKLHLRCPKAAYVYKKEKSLTAAAVNRAFDVVMSGATGRAIQRDVAVEARVANRDARHSWIIFRREDHPSFLDGTHLRDVMHGFMLVVELPTLVVVLKSGAAFDQSVFGPAITEVKQATLRRVFRQQETAYQKLRMRMMGVGRGGIRSRSAESDDDLAAAMSLQGANRSIPTGFQLRVGDQVFTITPGTGRVAERDARTALDGLLAWAAKVEDAMNNPAPEGGFMDNFATPSSLSDVPADLNPVGIRFNIDALHEEMEEGKVIRLLRERAGGSVASTALGDTGIRRLFAEARKDFEVRGQAKPYRIVSGGKRDRGLLKINNRTITVASRHMDRIVVEYADGRTKTLTKYVNDAQDFVVCFNDPQYAYTARQLFRDHNLIATLPGLLSVFNPVPGLANATTEKGTFTAASSRFDANSVFGVIQDEIGTEESELACDDLGDEWGDFLGIRPGAGHLVLSLYVAKGGAAGLSASAFHESCAQAVKNLCHLNPSPSELSNKSRKWNGMYRLDGVQTAIARAIKGGTAADIVGAISHALTSPTTVRRVCIVTSAVSKQEVTSAFDELNNGEAPCQVIQLVWLLTSFVGAARDAGAIPLIYCAP